MGERNFNQLSPNRQQTIIVLANLESHRAQHRGQQLSLEETALIYQKYVQQYQDEALDAKYAELYHNREINQNNESELSKTHSLAIRQENIPTKFHVIHAKVRKQAPLPIEMALTDKAPVSTTQNIDDLYNILLNEQDSKTL